MNLNDPTKQRLTYESCSNTELEKFIARFTCRRLYWSTVLGGSQRATLLSRAIEQISEILLNRASTPVWEDVIR